MCSLLMYALTIGLLFPGAVLANTDALRRNLQAKENQKSSPVIDAPVRDGAVVLPVATTGACPRRNLLFPFGLDAGDIYTYPNDDGSSDPVALATPVQFLSQTYTTAYQNTNGDISFEMPLSSFYWQYLPTANLQAMAAIYWHDIYTGNDGECQNDLWFRSSQRPDDLETANSIVGQGTGHAGFEADEVMVATWYRVDSLINQNQSATFQMAITWNRNATWAIFVYEELEFGRAASGFNDGEGVRGGMVDIIGNASEASSLLEGSNIGMPGVYIYQVAYDFESDIVPPTMPPTPSPTPCGTPPEAHLPFPFGAEANDIFTPPNDDGSSIPINLSIPITFQGQEYGVAFQNTNGHVTFGNSSYRYYWEYLPSANVPPMAAILWTDIYTGADGACKNDLWVRYSEDPRDLAIATEILGQNQRGCGGASGTRISKGGRKGSKRGGRGGKEGSKGEGGNGSRQGVFPGKGGGVDDFFMSMSMGTSTSTKQGKVSKASCQSFGPEQPLQAVLVATWYRVEAFGLYGSGLLDTFQLVMAWNGDETWAIFAYDVLDFYASSQHGSAIGFNGDDGVEGGLVGVANRPADAQTLTTGSNIGRRGVYVFEVTQILTAELILNVPPETMLPTPSPSVYPFINPSEDPSEDG